MEAGLKTLCDAFITSVNERGNNLPPLSGATVNATNTSANAGYIAMRFIAMAIAAGQDSDGRFTQLFSRLEGELKNNYVSAGTKLSDTWRQSPDVVLWMSYDHWGAYFYITACQLMKRTPDPALTNEHFTLRAMAGQGALRDIDLNQSESRRGKTTHWFNALYILAWTRRTSGLNAARSFMDNVFKNQWGPKPGYPGRFNGFLENTQGGPVPASDIPFLVNYLAEFCMMWEDEWGSF